ncbi:MAG: DNA-formamidopyrimidine glycosylase family protein [Gemmatimonadota bacterium]
MPELPDITVYIEQLAARVIQQRLERVEVANPFLLRTVEPPLRLAEGRLVLGLHRVGKRIVFELEGELYLVLHLMIAGRLRWIPAGRKLPGRSAIATLLFPNGRLQLTEAGSKRRASLHLVAGADAWRTFDRGGIDVLSSSMPEFMSALVSESHTLKRALTDPRLFSGIGNAYSDEILHRARLSPLTLTRRLTPEEGARLHAAAKSILVEWTDRLRRETGDGFPEKVTAFREGMAVHGRFREPCPVCGDPVQRIRYAENETNYCPTCQTEGRLLADRGLSRLLREDWPRSLEELEDRLPGSSAPPTRIVRTRRRKS